MSTKTQQVLMAVIAALVVIGVCLVWRSCGTEAMVTCPNGGKAEITSRGSFEQSNIESLCKELEGNDAQSE
jgi:hypothetical protein